MVLLTALCSDLPAGPRGRGSSVGLSHHCPSSLLDSQSLQVSLVHFGGSV